MKLVKVTVNINNLKNEVNRIHAEAFKATAAKSDNERRDILLLIVEQLRTLKTRLDNDGN